MDVVPHQGCRFDSASKPHPGKQQLHLEVLPMTLFQKKKRWQICYPALSLPERWCAKCSYSFFGWFNTSMYPWTHQLMSALVVRYTNVCGILHYYCTLTSIITLDRCKWETHLPEDTGRYIWTHIDSSKTSQPHTFSKQHTGGSERHQSNDGGFMPTTMSRISMRTILDVYTSSGPAPVFRLAQATAVPFWMPWVLMKKTLDRQNLAALWVSGNSLDIAEAFHSKDWKWGIQAAIKLYQSFRWIHSHSFYQQYSKQSYHDTNIIHSYSPSHFMLGNGKGRAWRFPTTHEAIERCQECRGSFVEQLLWRSKTSLCLLPLCACHAKA